MIAFAINLPPDVQAQINSAASQYSVDGFVASAVAQVSSGGRQFYPDNSLVVTPYGVGVMGISKEVAMALGFDATTQVGNIQAGVATLAALLGAFTGNYPFALAAYLTSVATVQKFDGIPPISQVLDFVYNVSTIAANAGSDSVSNLKALRNASTLDPSGATTDTGIKTAPATAGQLISPLTKGLDNITSNTAIQPLLQVADPSLSNTAWYADTGVVTGNKTIRASVQPVTFMVYFDRNSAKEFLKNPATNAPIEIQLNTSLSSFEITSKHVYNRTPSRTGMHITLWGMEPDLISGQGSTGVFMNQFGITDFMSVAGITDDVAQLLTQGFQHTFSPIISSNNTTVAVPSATVIGSDSDVLVTTDAQLSTGLVSSTLTAGQRTLNTAAGQAIARNAKNNQNEAFRVAAQDAFIELLKLFQLNGNIWFNNPAYANGANGATTNLGVIGQTEQNSPTAWSSKVGASSFQQHSRNNDVMTRGYVAMRYRNNIYLGYFKSLSWTQDADQPFQWKFNFAFQVEKTYTALYFSQDQVSMTQSTQNFLTTGTDITDQGNGQVTA